MNQVVGKSLETQNWVATKNQRTLFQTKILHPVFKYHGEHQLMTNSTATRFQGTPPVQSFRPGCRTWTWRQDQEQTTCSCYRARRCSSSPATRRGSACDTAWPSPKKASPGARNARFARDVDALALSTLFHSRITATAFPKATTSRRGPRETRRTAS